MVGFDRGQVVRFDDRQGGAALQDFGEQADMAGIKMRYQHEGEAGVLGAGAKEGFEGFQPAGGRADANDGEGGRRRGHGRRCRAVRHGGGRGLAGALRRAVTGTFLVAMETSLFLGCFKGCFKTTFSLM